MIVRESKMHFHVVADQCVDIETILESFLI